MGGFAFGYPSITLKAGFGGLMDVATGLLYVGEGQYYTCTALRSVQCRCDPQTGRFLTRNAKPNQSNPYLPFDRLLNLPSGGLMVDE